MPRHSIHLGAAWEPPAGAASPGWLRRFGRPSGLGPGERVVLVCDAGSGRPAWRRLLLNGQELSLAEATLTRFECDVTASLLPRNELVVEPLTAVPSRDGVRRADLPREWGRFTLEIDAPD
jgi:hypothetical protein